MSMTLSCTTENLEDERALSRPVSRTECKPEDYANDNGRGLGCLKCQIGIHRQAPTSAAQG